MNILFVNGCMRQNSRTYSLASAVLSTLNGNVTEINLEAEHISPLTIETLHQRDVLLQEKNLTAPSLRYANMFAEADTIVLAAPYWDLSFPAAVKAFLEAVTVTGVTFHYTAEGFPAGLCKAKKLIYVTTAGGLIMNYNLGYDYVKALAQLYYGIPETVCIKAENLDIIGADVEAILDAAKKEIPSLLNV